MNSNAPYPNPEIKSPARNARSRNISEADSSGRHGLDIFSCDRDRNIEALAVCNMDL